VATLKTLNLKYRKPREILTDPMSIKICTYVPTVSEEVLPRIAARFADFGMDCQFHPNFAMDPSRNVGMVFVRLRVMGDDVPQYKDLDLLSKFEIAFKDFRYTAPVSTNPVINERLKRCKTMVVVRVHANPTSSYRAGLYFSTFLAEANDGVVYIPQSDQYLEPAQALVQLPKQVSTYEAQLPPEDWMIERFTSW
jgi:hypothetical protein